MADWFTIKTNKYKVLVSESETPTKRNYQFGDTLMNTDVPFIDGRLLKICSAADETVIELVGNKLVTRLLTPTLVTDPNRDELQTFRLNLLESGAYEIQSIYQANPSLPLVWDYYSHRKLLMQRKKIAATGRSNQNWISNTVPGTVSNYFIISAPEGSKCLRNMGADQQVKLVPKTDEMLGDKFCHWKLISVESIQKAVAPVPVPVPGVP